MDFFFKPIPFGGICITSYTGNSKHVEIPTNLNYNVLSDFIFKGHTEIESINMPDTITQLGGFIFDGCSNLKSVTLPPKLEDMWQYALTRTSFEEIEIPGTVKKIVPFTFFDSKLLKKVIFNEGTERISANAFKGCESLEEIYVSENTEISDRAFEGCGEVRVHRGE